MDRPRPHFLRIAGPLCALVAGLTGCANLTPPSDESLYDSAMAGTQVPVHWAASARAAAFDPDWVGIADDGTLQSLIDAAVAHNLDLRVAASRMQQAAQQARLAGADVFPTVGVGARAASDPTPGSTFSANGYAIVVNWEIDLWGRARAEKLAGESLYRSAEADYAYARQSIGAMTAKSWVAALDATAQLALAQELEATTSQQLELVQYRRRIGKVSEMAVADWSAQRAAASDTVAQREQARWQALRALELMLGRYPAGDVQADAPLPSVPPPQGPGLPLDLLERRPDVVAARQRVLSAYFGAEEAKAARLPSIAIFAGAGRFTKDYSGLATSMQSWVFPVGGALTWPLFDAGRREVTLQLRTEQQREALALYARTILIAMAEVENGLTAEQQLALREQAIERQLSESLRSLELAQVQRQIGQLDTFDVLQRKREALQVKAELTHVRAQRLVQRVNLHLALGGRFSPEDKAPARAATPAQETAAR